MFNLVGVSLPILSLQWVLERTILSVLTKCWVLYAYIISIVRTDLLVIRKWGLQEGLHDLLNVILESQVKF